MLCNEIQQKIIMEHNLEI